MHKDLSIIIPVYNGSKYIEKCLESILDQEDLAFEVILIDDGSVDDTVNIFDTYKTDKRVSFIYNAKNIGQGLSRNKGLAAAEGTYILFVDVDDYLTDDKTILYKIVDFMRVNKLEILDCPYYIYEENKFKLKNLDSQEINTTGLNYLNTINILSATLCNKVFKRSLLKDNNIKFKKRKYEDVSFNLEAIIKAKRISDFREPFYNYIIQEGSTMTATPNKQNILDALELIDDLELLYIDYPNIFQVEKTFFYSFIGAARIFDRYPLSDIKNEKRFLYQKFKIYRKEILKSRTLNPVLRLSLYLSPFISNKLLLILKK